jgi:hypothetical protein
MWWNYKDKPAVAKDSMYVQVGGYINADAWASPNPVCQGTTVKLHAEGGDYYLWTGPNGFTSTEQEPVIDNMDQNKEGTYGVLITSKKDAKPSNRQCYHDSDRR